MFRFESIFRARQIVLRCALACGRCFLLLISFDVAQKVTSSFHEHGVRKDIMARLPSFSKSINIKLSKISVNCYLSDKRCVIIVLEIDGKYLFSEATGVEYEEFFTVRRPCNRVTM